MYFMLMCGFIFIVVINKVLIKLKSYLENKFKLENMKKFIVSRKDLSEFGMDYYLTLCKYIIIQKKLAREVYIIDITGREIVDIKFINNGNQVYASCLLKDTFDSEDLENVNYDEVMDLLNFMIKDGVKEGIIFTNSYVDKEALELINSLNKNSDKYKINLIDGYEIIKYARLRNENVEVNYA